MMAVRARKAADVRYRLSGDAPAKVDEKSRVCTFVISDESVARDGHIIRTNGIQVDNYLRNPVVCLAHDTGSPPIARTSNIWSSGTVKMADFQFPPEGTYDVADTIYRLIQGGFLNACSISWIPITWNYSTDKSRSGGIDFAKVDLLEISIVAVPSLPSALVTARSRGIDATPLGRWADKAIDRGLNLPGVDLASLSRAATAVPGGDSLADRRRRVEHYRTLAAGTSATGDRAADYGIDISTVEGRRRYAEVMRSRARRIGEHEKLAMTAEGRRQIAQAAIAEQRAKGWRRP